MCCHGYHGTIPSATEACYPTGPLRGWGLVLFSEAEKMPCRMSLEKGMSSRDRSQLGQIPSIQRHTCIHAYMCAQVSRCCLDISGTLCGSCLDRIKGVSCCHSKNMRGCGRMHPPSLGGIAMMGRDQ